MFLWTLGLFYVSDNSEQDGADASRCDLLCGEVSGRYRYFWLLYTANSCWQDLL